MLASDVRHQLLMMARDAFDARVCRRTVSTPSASEWGMPCHGAFVTVFHRGELRGCLGRTSSDLPLLDLICHLAQVVADSDPRFPAVRPGELEDTRLEISVLPPEREIAAIAEIEVGRHGLIVQHGSCRGLLLPQVPVEHGWDVETFVAHTCMKAGLSATAWRSGVRMFVFEAEVFGEDEH